MSSMNRPVTFVTRAALVVGLGLSVGALVGCKNDPIKGPFTPGADQLPKNQYPKVVVEVALARWLVVSEPIVAPAPNGGPLTVNVPLRLTSVTPNQFARVQYRYIFLDAAGVPLRTQSDWKYIRLEPRNQVFLQGNALDTTAVDWRLEIQSGR